MIWSINKVREIAVLPVVTASFRMISAVVPEETYA